MRRISSIFVAVSVAATGFATLGASGKAATCSSPVVVFSYMKGVGAVNSNFAPCTAESVAQAETDHDGRIINPGHDMISIRYLNDVKGRPETIWARLNGLGFERRWAVLQRVEMPGGAWGYDLLSPVMLRDGSSASGCLKVAVQHVVEKKKRTHSGKIKTIRKVIVNERTAFHTIDASC